MAKIEQISAYLAGCLFTILIGVLLYILCTRKIQNRYTRIAYGELCLALTLRTISCFLYAVKQDSDDLNTRLFDVLIF